MEESDESFDVAKRRFYDACERFRRVHYRPLMPAGFTPVEVLTLMVTSDLLAEGEQVRPGLLAERAHTSPSALSQVLKSLESKGVIERRRASSDSRAIVIELTEVGQEVAHECRARREAHLDAVLACMGEETLTVVADALERVLELHERMAAEGTLERAECPPFPPFPGAKDAPCRKGVDGPCV